LTLAGVEQASRRFPEPIAVDYLSRLERGTLMPSVPKLATLAHVYQRPLTEFVDLYELENLRELVPAQEGDFWYFRKLGIDYASQGDHKRSAAAMLRGLDAARAFGGIDAIAQALASAGIALNQISRFNAAQRFFEEALRVVRNDRIRGYAFWGLARTHYHLDDHLLAEMLCEKAAGATEEDPRLQAYVRDLQASILSDRGRYGEAAKMKKEVLDAYEKLGESQNVTTAQYGLGENLVKAGMVDEGLAILRDSMGRAAEVGDPRLRAQSAIFYGRSLYAVGRYDDAIAPFKSAFRIARDRGMHQQAFDSAFYLWRLSDERGFHVEGDWLGEARRFRPEVEQRSVECREFDAWLANERRKPRAGRKLKDLM
jgi:tetratricopeptide (TPR) repeat protein